MSYQSIPHDCHNFHKKNTQREQLRHFCKNFEAQEKWLDFKNLHYILGFSSFIFLFGKFIWYCGKTFTLDILIYLNAKSPNPKWLRTFQAEMSLKPQNRTNLFPKLEFFNKLFILRQWEIPLKPVAHHQKTSHGWPQHKFCWHLPSLIFSLRRTGRLRRPLYLPTTQKMFPN